MRRSGEKKGYMGGAVPPPLWGSSQKYFPFYVSMYARYMEDSFMPVKKYRGGFKYGSKGKVYRGKDAKTKAKKQGQAIEANKKERKK